MRQLLPLCFLFGCTTPDALSTERAELTGAPVLIQAGTDQYLLAVTDDNFAVYQEGQALYATRLAPGAPRTFVANVPNTNLAQVLQVGKVVFIWTDPQRNLPGFGVSPLVLWTAKEGAQVISAQSAVGLVATAASSDSKQIVFTTNVTDDGTRGDLAHALTRDALHPTTLVADTPLAFPSGQCRPLANFGRDHGREVPVAAYCAGTATTATFSKWVGGVKTDLVSNIATPMPFLLESEPDLDTFLFNLADTSVVTVAMRGGVTVIDQAISPIGFVGKRAVGYVAVGAPTELRLARKGHAPEAISNVSAVYRNTYNRSGYSRRSAVSADGLVLFGTVIGPNTGLTDMNLLDVRDGDVFPLNAATDATVFSEVFTSDGERALYFNAFDPTTFVATLVAGGRHHNDTIAEGVWDVLAAVGSDVSYSTAPIVDFTSTKSFYLGTGDLFVTDVECNHPRQVATQASLFYLPSHNRTKLAFTSPSEPAGPGLYLASARP